MQRNEHGTIACGFFTRKAEGGGSQTILLARRLHLIGMYLPGAQARLRALVVGWVRMLGAVKERLATHLEEKRASLEGSHYR
jgi:hypothetical protein